MGLGASSVSRKLSANCCDGRALKIWGLIEGWGVAEDKMKGRGGKHDGDQGYNQLIKTKKVLQKYFPVQWQVQVSCVLILAMGSATFIFWAGQGGVARTQMCKKCATIVQPVLSPVCLGVAWLWMDEGEKVNRGRQKG